MPVEETQRQVRRILEASTNYANDTGNLTEKIDHVVLHAVVGPLLLAVIMFLATIGFVVLLLKRSKSFVEGTTA